MSQEHGKGQKPFEEGKDNILKEQRHCRIPLPLELNCQIFGCLKFGIQRKFIGGLGRGIYAIFWQKVLTKCKILRIPERNGWEYSNTSALISFNGLLAGNNTGNWLNVFARKGFPISAELSRKENFPGTILYYFEITKMASYAKAILVGLSSGNMTDGTFVGFPPNSYAISYGFDYCWLSGYPHDFEWPNGTTKPEWNGPGDVIGCGLVLNPENELSIFFTGNGILMGKPIPINSTANFLYPTVTMYGFGSVKANFGGNSAKPFKYDIDKCPGMGYE